MKKINSLVLLVAMLLLCTSVAKGATHEVGTTEAFTSAWTSAASGDVIKLTKTVSLSATLWLGTTNIGDASRSLEIDLNGNELRSNAVYAFMITHGKLKISNSNPAAGQLVGESKCKNVFYLTGSTNKDVDPSQSGVDYFTHLELAQGVIVTQTYYDATIGVFELNKGGVGQTALASAIPSKPALTYITNVYAATETKALSVAHGVRVDVKGTINGTKYGIKTNGNLGSPNARVEAGTTDILFSTANWPNLQGYTIAATDVNYSPFVYIHPTGRITVAPNPPAGQTKYPTAIYASGYARWKIEGYAEGCTGAVVKSGEVDFHDATVVGTGSTYTPAVETNSGNGCSGSAIVVVSSANYAGDMEVTVSGDSQVSATNGYAVEEDVVAAGGDTKVDALSITGGSFQGGTVPVDPEDPSAGTFQGTISITETTADDSEIVITGGTIGGNDVESVKIGDQNLADFLADSQDETMHVTTTDDGKGGKVLIITEGEATELDPNILTKGGEDVNWGHLSPLDVTPMSVEISEDLAIANLTMNQDFAQTITVKEGKTFTIANGILGENAQIIVEAGATFIVTGTNGIHAPSNTNLVLKTAADNPSIFLFNPEVTTNRYPHATVELMTKSYYASASDYLFERIGIPTHVAPESFTCGSDIRTRIWDFYNNNWRDLSSGTKDGKPHFISADAAKLNTPFATYNLMAYTEDPGTIYTMTGALQGNDDVDLSVSQAWAGFSNSYTAEIDIEGLLACIPDGGVDQTVYVSHSTGPGTYTWEPVNEVRLDLLPSSTTKKLPPMRCFKLHRSGASGVVTADYGTTVYEPVAGAPAPRRRAAASNVTSVNMVVANAQGVRDELLLAESSDFTSEYESGRDAEKYMNDDINLYAHANVDLAIMATDNLADTYIGFSTVEGGVFIISFKNVDGREFELIDLATNITTEVKEGNTYTFSAAANTNADHRFKLVERVGVVTNIDAVSAESGAKGVFTVLGQYVGEMNLWNNLPAGVYVVDGKKVVK